MSPDKEPDVSGAPRMAECMFSFDDRHGYGPYYAVYIDDAVDLERELHAREGELLRLKEAVENLLKVKGRYHTEIAYKQLESVFYNKKDVQT